MFYRDQRKFNKERNGLFNNGANTMGCSCAE